MRRSDSSARSLPVAVIGAGPIGLAAAAHLVARGEVPLVLEAGSAVGASVRAWGHVRLFSPWKYLVDPVVRGMLEATGWNAPDPERLPRGADLVAELLEPLAALPQIAPHLRMGREVIGVTRLGMDLLASERREAAPFEIVARAADGLQERYRVRAVIDASGSHRTPNPLGSGVPAAGEMALRERVFYGIPDVAAADRGRYAGRRTLVVGSGHSAMNAVLELAGLARREPGTEVIWAIRAREPHRLFGGGPRDALPARGALGGRLRALVEDGEVRLVTGFRARALERAGEAVRVEGEGGEIGPVDELIVATGFRPELSFLREVRLSLDPKLESPLRLAPLIDPDQHSCGTVYPHGAAELAHPERDLYVVGVKSYGRAPTFLLLTGYEQVRSVVCALVGDETGARAVQLQLPETGVCRTDAAAEPCCPSESPREPTPIGGSCGVASACAEPALASAPTVGDPPATAGCCA